MSAEAEQKEEIVKSIEEDQDLLLSSSEAENDVKEVVSEVKGKDTKKETKLPVVEAQKSEVVPEAPKSIPAVEEPKVLAETTLEAPKSTPVVAKTEAVAETTPVIEETKEQARLKKLEEARKKIERLKNKKNIASQQSKEPTPVAEDVTKKPDSVESITTSGNDKINELNKVIADLKNTINNKDAEILKLKDDLNKERQLNKDLQMKKQTVTPASMPQLSVSYEPVDFSKWKNYTIDMSEWRSIGSGPIVQF